MTTFHLKNAIFIALKEDNMLHGSMKMYHIMPPLNRAKTIIFLSKKTSFRP